MVMKPIVFVFLFGTVCILYMYVDFRDLLENPRFTEPKYKQKQMGYVDTRLANKSDNVTLSSTTGTRSSNANKKGSGNSTMPNFNNRIQHSKMNQRNEHLIQTDINMMQTITGLEQKQLGNVKNTQRDYIMTKNNSSTKTKKKVHKKQSINQTNIKAIQTTIKHEHNPSGKDKNTQQDNVISSFTYNLSDNKSEQCRPRTSFVFVKTGKTGSSTLSSILHSFGEKNGLKETFIQSLNAAILNNSIYDFIACHFTMGRDTYKATRQVIPNAKYISIIRFPYTQVESLFYYKRHNIILGIENDTNAFKTFLLDPHIQERSRFNVISNQIRWFGHDIKQNTTQKIQEINDELDLMMITDYMDESLVLLKQMMCWSFHDIVYASRRVVKRKRLPMTTQMKQILKSRLTADLMLYDYFNKTLWQKIKNYDGDFEKDLHDFRALQESKRLSYTEMISQFR
ncbi:galactosylceramide sulfotransferase-like [Saccoglossus kowalevskii]